MTLPSDSVPRVWRRILLRTLLATTPSAAVQVTRVPYSFKPGGAVPYSVKLEGGVQAAPAGGVTTGVTTPAVEPVVTPPVVEAPPVNETPAVVEVPVNETPVVEAPVNVTPTAPVEEPAFSIMGKVFDDANGNGAIDENETGLAGWTVSLEQPVGTVIANQTTAEDGSYAFMGLSVGEYAVSEIVQMGWTLVSPADGKYVVTVTNMTIANLDFANQMLPVEAAPEWDYRCFIGEDFLQLLGVIELFRLIGGGCEIS